MTDALLAEGQRWLAEIGDDPCGAVLDAEPVPRRVIDDLDRALTAVADFTDLKSPYFRGHPTGVARLATDAARSAGLDDTLAVGLGRAALVHDVGRVGVPSGMFRPGQFDTIKAPTLLLAGSESPADLAKATDHACNAIPDARIHTLAGHAHMAHKSDPAMVGALIRQFNST